MRKQATFAFLPAFAVTAATVLLIHIGIRMPRDHFSSGVVILSIGIILFGSSHLIASIVSAPVGQGRYSSFLLLYLTLGLITLGLLAVFEADHLGSGPFWSIRDIQYLGDACIFVAVGILIRESIGRLSPIRMLLEAQHRYTSLVDSSPDAVLVISQTGCLFANIAAANLLGTASPAHLVGRTVNDFVAEQDKRRASLGILRSLSRNGRSVPTEFRLVRLDGREIEAETVGVRVAYKGTPAVQVVLHDRTEQKAAERKLRESEERFRTLLDGLLDVAYRRDLTTDEYDYLSPSVEQVLGYSQSELKCFSMQDIGVRIHPEDRETVRIGLERAAVSGSERMEYRLRGRDGLYRWIADHATIEKGADGAPRYYSGTVRDISDQKQAMEMIRGFAERLRILREIDNAILNATSLSDIVDTTFRFFKLLMPVLRMSLVMLPDTRECGSAVVAHTAGADTIRSGDSVPIELFGSIENLAGGRVNLVRNIDELDQNRAVSSIRAAGVRAWMSVPLLSRDSLVGIMNIGFESSDSLNDEAVFIAQELAPSVALAVVHDAMVGQLTDQATRMRLLAGRLSEIDDDERMAVSHELHDRVGRDITVLSISLGRIGQQLADGGVAGMENLLNEPIRLVGEISQGVREVMERLRPSVLSEYGLFSALCWLGEDMTRNTGIRCDVEGIDPELPLAADVENHLFRIAQEAILNAVKHSGADRIRISLQNGGGFITLQISDNGSGRIPNKGVRSVPGTGYGQSIMYERAELIGATIDIVSSPEKGTSVTVRSRR